MPLSAHYSLLRTADDFLGRAGEGSGGGLLLQIGDKVVYPMHGAGEIAGIENCEIFGEEKTYYVLQMPIGNMKVMIPMDNVDNVGLRDIISADGVREVQDVLQRFFPQRFLQRRVFQQSVIFRHFPTLLQIQGLFRFPIFSFLAKAA